VPEEHFRRSRDRLRVSGGSVMAYRLGRCGSHVLGPRAQGKRFAGSFAPLAYRDMRCKLLVTRAGPPAPVPAVDFGESKPSWSAGLGGVRIIYAGQRVSYLRSMRMGGSQSVTPASSTSSYSLDSTRLRRASRPHYDQVEAIAPPDSGTPLDQQP